MRQRRRYQSIVGQRRITLFASRSLISSLFQPFPIFLCPSSFREAVTRMAILTIRNPLEPLARQNVKL